MATVDSYPADLICCRNLLWVVCISTLSTSTSTLPLLLAAVLAATSRAHATSATNACGRIVIGLGCTRRYGVGSSEGNVELMIRW